MSMTNVAPQSSTPTPSRKPSRERPPLEFVAPPPVSSNPLTNWLHGRQDAARAKRQKAQDTLARQKLAQISATTTGRLPDISQVLAVSLIQNLDEIVLAELPEALRTQDDVQRSVRYHLQPDRIADQARTFVGNGEYLFSVKGKTSSWVYDCQIGLSLSLSASEPTVTVTKAAMDSSSKMTGGLADKRAVTSGGTYSLNANVGRAATILPVGGTATAGASYKDETTKDLTSTQGFERTNNVKYEAGSVIFTSRARMAIGIRYTKKARHPAARGQTDKRKLLDWVGIRSSDGPERPMPDYKAVFSDIPIIYSVPAALAHLPTPPTTAESSSSTDTEEVWEV